jgi:hypothetical protein
VTRSLDKLQIKSGSIPNRKNRFISFLKHPVRTWDRANLLLNVYRRFCPRGQSGRKRDPNHFPSYRWTKYQTVRNDPGSNLCLISLYIALNLSIAPQILDNQKFRISVKPSIVSGRIISVVCVRKVLSSNLVPHISYHDWGFSSSLLVPVSKYWDGTSK